MKENFQILVWQEPPYFIAKCLDLSVASQGKTRQEALERLKEAVKYFLEDNPEPVELHKYELDRIGVGV